MDFKEKQQCNLRFPRAFMMKIRKIILLEDKPKHLKNNTALILYDIPT